MFRRILSGCKISLMVFSLLSAVTVSAQKTQFPDSKQKADSPMLFAERNAVTAGERFRLRGQDFVPSERVRIAVDSISPDGKDGFLVDEWFVSADSRGSVAFDWTAYSKGSYRITAFGDISRSAASKFLTADNLVPAPVVVGPNFSCADANANAGNFPSVTQNWGLRFGYPNPNGTFIFDNAPGPITLTGTSNADPNNTVTVATTNGGTNLAWSATIPITAVIVSNGTQANGYSYDPYSLADPGALTAPGSQAIQSIEFCFPIWADIVIVKHATPASTFQFDFTTTGLAPSSFSLIDNDLNSDPSISFRASEGLKTIQELNPGFYSLRSIDCVVTGPAQSSTTTVNLLNRSVDIDLQDDDLVTCTFNNDFVTAAMVSAAGKVFDQFGRPIYGAIVSVTDSSGAVRSARTNNLGYYRIEDLESGGSYFFSAAHKSYSFGSQVLTLDGDNNSINFNGTAR